MDLDREVPCIYGPVAVALPNGGLEIFAIRQDNYLRHIWTTGPGTWNGKIKNEKAYNTIVYRSYEKLVVSFLLV
jgi:hypothetical protein